MFCRRVVVVVVGKNGCSNSYNEMKLKRRNEFFWNSMGMKGVETLMAFT